jgi:hypothetical protein
MSLLDCLCAGARVVGAGVRAVILVRGRGDEGILGEVKG